MAELNPPSPSPSHEELQHHALGFNGMVIGAALVCALLFALGLNTMLQCVFRCPQRAVAEPAEWIAKRRTNSGLKRKEMGALPTSTFDASSRYSSCCAICLAEFVEGERLRELPECCHKFHVACIDRWLLSRSSCPTCRHRLTFSSLSTDLDIVTII